MSYVLLSEGGYQVVYPLGLHLHLHLHLHDTLRSCRQHKAAPPERVRLLGRQCRPEVTQPKDAPMQDACL